MYSSATEDISGFLPLKILEMCLVGTATVLDTTKEEMGFEALEKSMKSIEVNIYKFSNQN